MPALGPATSMNVTSACLRHGGKHGPMKPKAEGSRYIHETVHAGGGEHLHEAMKENQGVAVDVCNGLGLSGLPGLLTLVLAPHGLVQHCQLPGLCNHCARRAACPSIQGSLLEPAQSPQHMTAAALLATLRLMEGMTIRPNNEKNLAAI